MINKNNIMTLNYGINAVLLISLSEYLFKYYSIEKTLISLIIQVFGSLILAAILALLETCLYNKIRNSIK